MTVFVFHSFCNVCCADYNGPVPVAADTLADATQLLRKWRVADAADEPDAAPLEVWAMQPGFLETEVEWLAIDQYVPPCGACGKPVADHLPAGSRGDTCRFNHPERQSAPDTPRSRIAEAFVADLRANLSADQFAEMKRRNATPAYRQACASHDFLDANESMQAAFTSVVGHQANPTNAADTALWNSAWELARLHDLTDQ